MLNQFTANAIGRQVVVGPVEATAAGNVLMQMFSDGEISSLAEGRDVIRRSFDLTTCVPEEADEWDEAYEQFVCILQRQ